MERALQYRREDWGSVDTKDKPLDGYIVGYYTENENGEREHHKLGGFWYLFWSHAFAWRHDKRNDGRTTGAKRDTFREKGVVAVEIEPAHGTWDKHTDKHALVTDRRYAKAADGHATDAGGHGHAITIETSQISRVSSYEPAHSTFLRFITP